MTQKAALSADDEATLEYVMKTWREAERLQELARSEIVAMIERSSYREVARLTGFSTNTLQRWKREAGK